MEVEKKSSPVVSTIQVEVAEAMEAFRIDSSQWWDNDENKAPSTGFATKSMILYDRWTTIAQYSILDLQEWS